MNVGIYPNEESALQALVLESFDIFLLTGFEGCCHTAVIVPNGPYSDMFEGLYETYIPKQIPTAHSYFERNKTLTEVVDEITLEIPEARFFDQRAGV